MRKTTSRKYGISKCIGRGAAMLFALLALSVSVFADTVYEPSEVVESQRDDVRMIEKIYVLPKGSDEALIPKDGFTQNDVTYIFDRLEVQDNTLEDVREHTENVSCKAASNDAETVAALFSPTIEISTEDGYIGTLDFDLSSLEVEPAGYGNYKVTVTEERSYPNLASADTSLVPKIISKDGVALTLSSIEWTSSASEDISGIEAAVRYTANAEYVGTDTKTYVNGYVASADYKGKVKKVLNDTVTCTAVFKEYKEENTPMTIEEKGQNQTNEKNIPAGMIAGISAGAVLLAGAGYAAVRLIRRKKKG